MEKACRQHAAPAEVPWPDQSLPWTPTEPREIPNPIPTPAPELMPALPMDAPELIPIDDLQSRSAWPRTMPQEATAVAASGLWRDPYDDGSATGVTPPATSDPRIAWGMMVPGPSPLEPQYPRSSGFRRSLARNGEPRALS
ncbi:MAG: hypothetical protein R3B96_24045 [Pirellulaceae bacterium]